MAKAKGPSVIPGGQLKLPMEYNIPTEELFAPANVKTEPTPEDNPFVLNQNNIETVAEQDKVTTEITTDATVDPVPNQNVTADNMTETLAEGATTNIDEVQAEMDRIPSIYNTLGITSLDPALVNKEMPIYQALERGNNFSKVLAEEVGGSKMTGNVRYTPASFQLYKETQDPSVLVESGLTDEAFMKRTDDNTIIQPTAPIKKGSLVNTSTQPLIYQKELLDASIMTPEGQIIIDPELGRTMSLTTETFLLQSMFESNDESKVIEGLDPDDGTPGTVSYKLTKAKGNEQLGRDIFRNWKRIQNEQRGLPTDSYIQEYDQVSSEAFTFLGDQAKEIYSRANPDILTRNPVLVNGQVEFTLTQEGINALDVIRDKAKGLMSQPEVKPNLAATDTGKKETEAKTLVRNTTTALGPMGNTAVVDEAMLNANKTAFVNDPRREAVLFMLGTAAMIRAANPDANAQSYPNMFNIGFNKLQDAQNEKARLMNASVRAGERGQNAKSQRLQKQSETYNPQSVLQEQREKFLNVMGAAAEYSGQANHLTFALQALTGRIHSQQTLYNPQAHKIIRFLAGSGNVYQFKPNESSELNNLWKEVISSHLFEKKFKKEKGFSRSPQERIKIFDQESTTRGGLYDQYVRWGNQLLGAKQNFKTKEAKDLVMQFRNVTKAQENAQTAEVKKGLRQKLLNEFGNDLLDNDLKAYLGNLEEEAILHADYLMDLAKWDNANKNNLMHKSSIIMELDGKTHGPATMAMLLGSIPIAKRAGVLVPDTGNIATKLEEYKDLRDAMADSMMLKVESASGSAGAIPANELPVYKEILSLAIQDRTNFLKKSPMTMGYGQDLVSLEQHVDTTVFMGTAQNSNGYSIRDLIQQNKLDTNKVIDFLHATLVDSIYETFDSNTLQINQVIKSNAQASVLMEQILSFENAMGFTSYLSGKETDPEQTTQGQFEFRNPRQKVAVQFYKTKTSPSAVRMKEGMAQVGGRTVGLSLPVPVQSYDGNMVSRTLSGQSYEKIKADTERLGGSNVFVLPIFDAFVTDLGSLQAVRAEANKHHKEGIINHDYTQSIMEGWFNNAMSKFEARDPGQVVDWKSAKDLEVGAEFKGIAHLLSKVSESGKTYTNLNIMLSRMSDERKMPDETIEQYRERKGLNAARKSAQIKKIIESSDINLNADTLTVGEVKFLVNTILGPAGLDLKSRNNKALNLLKKRRAEFKSMVGANATNNVDHAI